MSQGETKLMYISFDLSGKGIKVLIVGRAEDNEKIVYFLYPLLIEISKGVKATFQSVEVLLDDSELVFVTYKMGDIELTKPLANYWIGDR
jgi:hypothetical protein